MKRITLFCLLAMAGLLGGCAVRMAAPSPQVKQTASSQQLENKPAGRGIRSSTPSWQVPANPPEVESMILSIFDDLGIPLQQDQRAVPPLLEYSGQAPSGVKVEVKILPVVKGVSVLGLRIYHYHDPSNPLLLKAHEGLANLVSGKMQEALKRFRRDAPR